MTRAPRRRRWFAAGVLVGYSLRWVRGVARAAYAAKRRNDALAAYGRGLRDATRAVTRGFPR